MKNKLRISIATTLLLSSIVSSAETPDALAVDMAKSFASIANKSSPRMLDEYTRLERVYSESLDIIFDYTILAAIPEYSEVEHRGRLRDNFIRVMCDTPKFHDQLLSKGVKQIYRYSNTTGRILREFTFSIDDCA
ncbi:hypothetical protein [Microbulbifer sp. PSTR4-B]|uniref:hypothetical protein n=1 Tax=Microbulbifer sp. PSTR4-B TaxID=3243396 RepID=UPI0040399BEF